jgi:hypothetical protein
MSSCERTESKFHYREFPFGDFVKHVSFRSEVLGINEEITFSCDSSASDSEPNSDGDIEIDSNSSDSNSSDSDASDSDASDGDSSDSDSDTESRYEAPLKFVPSLGWWAARAFARHMNQHKQHGECNVCDKLSTATNYARERVERALYGADGLEWMEVVTANKDTNHNALNCIAGYIMNKPYDLGDLILTEKKIDITFEYGGEVINVQQVRAVRPQKTTSGLWHMLCGDRRIKLPGGFVCQQVMIEEGAAYYTGIDEFGTYMSVQLSIDKNCMIQTALSNGLLRKAWVPVSGINHNLNRCRWNTVPAIIVHCEFDKIEHTEKQVGEV